jgi:hypothetical protein
MEHWTAHMGRASTDRVSTTLYVGRMALTHKRFIAGERVEDLVATMRQMPITGIHRKRAQITFNLGDDLFVTWARATERYAADLLVAGNPLTWHERIELAAQRVTDEVAAAVAAGTPDDR